MKKSSKKIAREEKKTWWEGISIEIKKSVLAVLLVGMTVVLLLASFDKAGPAGNIIYKGLFNFFGWGYYLFPAVAVVIALVFLLTSKIEFLGPTFIGSLVLIMASLGLLDVTFPGKAGLAGNIIGLIQMPFGYTASLVIIVAIIIASLMITINVPIQFTGKKKNEIEEKDLQIKEPLASAINQTTTNSVANQPPAKETSKNKKDEASEFSVNPHKKIGLNYNPPPLSLLKSAIEKPTAGDLRANANIIKRTLDSFNIPVEMGEINIGPKVTRYTLKPAEGIKLSRITSLNSDLALALAAHPLRIEAPIPGKSLVGIEIPNKSAAIVRLGNLLPYLEFSKSGPLTFILGRDVSGELISANIEKMPHLLISGSTGSGKSILIHSIIISLLYKNSPETLRLALIDPKRVELSVYNDIPHLIAPVVINGKKAINVFRWAIQEMEQRYEKLLKANARDINSYNNNEKNETMPYLLLVVDELADLMASFGREIESSIVRLAQMARATGIHLILATQRPSVEVITGLIKANITARVALQVASQIDSRTILDIAGAEKLLGGGDMLFISSDFSKPKRIQGAYVSEKEVEEVTDFIKTNNPSNPAADQKEENLSDEPSVNSINFEELPTNLDDEDDELFDEAVEAVRQAGKASASLLQRRLKVGYARAARLLDIMESKKLIGPGDGAKAREIYLDQKDSEDIQ